MDFYNNTILFVFLFMLNISLMNHLSICKASDQDLCISSERHALLNFKHHLLDPSNRLVSWSENTNCCNWTLVVCNNVSGHILQLHLRTSPSDDYAEYETFKRSQFGGEIDPSILALSYLSYLDLSGNDFGDMHIPSFLGSMKSLTYLNLSYAGFSGSIPYQVGNLSNLLHLDLGGNDFTGKIPHQIGNLSNLLYLCLEGGYQDMDEISMYVENLQWMSSLSSLQYLELGYINLSNSFDWFHVLQSLPSLIELHLSSCAIPNHFPPANPINFSSLAILDLSKNYNDICAYLIPKWISQLKNLVSLKLSSNYLQGSILNSIQNLTLIEDLDLSQNLFNSSIPDWLYTLTHLKSLRLFGNKLQGPISHAIGKLTSLVTLELDNNQLEGPIPSSLGNLSSLNHLDLSRNSIYGAIPISLGNLSSLNHLGLSMNKIGGNPFDIVQSLSALKSLHISDNLFEGEVTEDHLANFTNLYSFDASRNKLILKVGPNWNPPFQKLNKLYMASWNLGPHFPSWMKSLKHLEWLIIPNTNISDSIPTWVWDSFRNAKYLDFSNNYIHGDISHIIKNPINVSEVDLSSNHLSGPLPHISPNVFDLDLSNNSFSGSLDSFLCQEKVKQMGLKKLNLESNNLSGEIPDCLMMWPNLMVIKFDSNNISGNLPQSLGSLSWLCSLQLRNNALSGKFPISLKKNTGLVFLDLSKNQFSGIIPLWVGYSLLKLKVFLLRSNKFVGSIPNQICCLNSLQILDLAENNLKGQIPKCISNLTTMLIMNTGLDSLIWANVNRTGCYVTDVLLALKGRLDDFTFPGIIMSIDLSKNKLSGEIPLQITSLTGLQFLNLSNNLLHGKIPQSIGNMGSLQSIDLSENKLSSKIPQSISKLNFLNKLNLSHNNLIGKVPTGTQLQSLEADSFVGNDLCGPPLPNNCKDPKHDHNAKEGKAGINWFYVSMSLGFVSGFWAVVGPLLYSRSWRLTYFWYIDRMWYKLQSFWW